MTEVRWRTALRARIKPVPDDRLLRPQEAADYLGVSLGTLYNWSSQRKVPVVKIGSRIRFRRESLERFAAKHERQPVSR